MKTKELRGGMKTFGNRGTGLAAGVVLLACLAVAPATSLAGQWQAPPDAPLYDSDHGPFFRGWLQDQQGAIYSTAPNPDPTSYSLWRWTKCGGWQVIGTVGTTNGMEAGATAFFAKGSDIYFAGTFDVTQSALQPTAFPTENITKFNVDTGMWTAVGDNTMTYGVTCLCVDWANNVYIGTGIGGEPGTLVLNELLVWNGSAWSPLGGGVWESSDLVRYNTGISALGTDGTNVYVAGTFAQGYNGPPLTPTLMKWTGSSWQGMGTYVYATGKYVFNYVQLHGGYDPDICSITVCGNTVWVTGAFSGPDTPQMTSPINLARFDANGGGIITPYTDARGASGGSSLTSVNGTVYLAGDFTDIEIPGIETNTAYGFAQFANGSWLPIGNSGTDLMYYNGDFQWVPAIGSWISADTNAVYLDGYISEAGTVSCAGTVRWLLNQDTEPFSSCAVTLGAGTYSDSGFSFPVYGQPGSGWQAESSIDDVNWQPVRNPFTLWGGSAVFTDPEPFANQYTFYSVFNNCCQGPVMASTQVGAEASAWWPLNDNAIDVIGGLNGTLSGTASFAPGAIGTGMFTSTKPSGVTAPDGADLDFGAGADFSIDCWIQPQNASTSYGVMEILSKRLVSGGATEGYELCLVNGQVVFQMSSTMNSPLSAGWTGPDLRDGAWHHVAVTVQRSSSTGGNIYVDGAVISTFNPTSQSGSLGTIAALLLGMHPDLTLDCNFRGGIDEAAMYQRVLTVNGSANPSQQRHAANLRAGCLVEA